MLTFLTSGKKHISQYAHKPDSELNDDQKRTRQTLPGLEASHKELEEMKKNLEVCFSYIFTAVSLPELAAGSFPVLL